MTVVRDADGRVVYVSPQVEQMLGIPAARYASMTVEELLHPDDLARIEAERRRLRAGEIDGWQMELRIRDGRGGYRTVVDHRVRLGEKLTRGVAIDITELLEAERRARAAVAELHSDTVQVLCAAAIQIELARRDHLEDHRLAAVQEMLRGVLRRTRRLMGELTPATPG